MESLSMQLVPVFDWLLRTTLQAGLLFCLIMLVQLILRGRLPIRWHYCLWLLLLVRMASPWLPESKISIFNWVPQSIQQGGIIESLSQTQDAHDVGFYLHADTTYLGQAEAEAAIVRFARMLPLLWLLGTTALAVYVGACNFHLWWLVIRERPLTDEKILDLLEDCKAEMGVRNILGIVTTDKVKSAALFGFVRPRLLLPAGMVEALNPKELRYVFLHELGHLRRRDIYVGWLMSLLQVLHWFNPLVWLAFYRMQSDRELACDALVLTHARSGESEDYGRTIVRLLERFSHPKRLPSMAGILETKSQLKRRIKMIAKFKKTSRTRWAGAMLLLAALACVVLTNAYVAKADFTFGTPTNLGPIVNSSAGDASPSISADGLELYFSSNRSGGSGDYDLWVTTRDTKDDEWDPPMNLGPTVNTSDVDRCPSISADGLSLFFGSRNRAGGAGHDDVWVTTRDTKDDPWGAPVNLGPTVNGPSAECDPSISSDGLSLFFRVVGGPGGFGRQDLRVTTRATSDDDWGPAVNLGPAVNSASSEFGPSISADDLTLFFRSNRPGGYGEGDLYVTMRATTSDPWSTPVNLGPTVNSSSGDADPSISDDGSTLFFSSRRPGGLGPPDLWQVRIEPIVDLNGDGIVDSADICIIIDHWGTDQPLCDVGPMPWGDGIVDVQDLIVLAEHLFEEIPLAESVE
ncbi:MAG: M56 family metallopeptidase [Planctomycetota bacterium]|jgi:beta-lactamase regulating signal transducer with metallopeptidase domain